MIGRTLSHYKVLEEISRGGWGIVYETERKQPGAGFIERGTEMKADEVRCRTYGSPP